MGASSANAAPGDLLVADRQFK